MKQNVIVYNNPGLTDNETTALVDWLIEEWGSVEEYGDPYRITKKKFLELDVCDPELYEADDEDDQERFQYILAIMDKINDLQDDDMLEIPLNLYPRSRNAEIYTYWY